MDVTVSLQRHLEDMEERSRQNSLWIRGLPEATGPEDLAATVTAIFQRVSGDAFPNHVEFNRIHRVLGPRSNDPARPRDMICRLHR